ncbi:MAG TPA: RICIN domain-containing protein [Tahibacter sp.]|nr:RICIN domain-containing protein [Tahibacter sp.]
MAIRLDTNAHYFLVPRHSEKQVLEVKDASTASGVSVQQNAPVKDKASQQFGFNPTRDGMYAIRCRHSQHVFDVWGISKDDGANVVQHPWHNGLNQQFRLLDAGDGYVFIEAVHSGKLIGVDNGSKDAGVKLVQRSNPAAADAAAYQFRLVLATPGAPASAIPGFRKPTDLMRDVGLGAIGLAPYVGGAFKFIVGVFWPDQSLRMLWDQMTEYVDRYVDARITQERLNALNVALTGAQKNLKDLSVLKAGSEKLGFFNAAYAAINQVDRAFFDASKADRTLAYLIAMGTLKLAMLAELTMRYSTIATGTDENAEGHRAWLADAIVEYARAASDYRAAIRAQRLAKVQTRAQIDYNYHAGIVAFRLRDDHDGADYRRIIDLTNDERRIRAVESKLAATAKQIAEAQYDAELDAVFASTLLWNSYGPDKPAPKREAVKVDVGPFGSDFNAQTTLARDAAIEGVRVYGGSTLVGVAVKTGGAWHSAGKIDGVGNELELKAGERFVSVYGTANTIVTSIRFETNFGRRIGAGDDIIAPRFSADLAADLGPTLIGVAASPHAKGIEGITLQWRYERVGKYPALPALRAPARKRAAKKKVVVKKTAAKKVAAKKAVAKKAVAKKKPVVKKAVAKKAAVKKPAVKKPAAKKVVAKKAAAGAVKARGAAGGRKATAKPRRR